MKPAAVCDFEMTGLLVEHAQARIRQLDDEGHNVPVLCMHVEIESSTRAHAIVEEPFPAGHERQCEARARELRKGARVTFRAPSVGIQLLVRNASHVHLHKADEAAAEPTTA